MKRLILLLLLTTMPVMAQTTTVTGTIVDPNGNPYASGTASAQKSVATGQVQPPPVNVTTNGSGTFSMTLLSPASYIFTVCAPPTQIGPTGNPTPVAVCFSNSAPISVSGASQDVSGNLNPVAKTLGPNITGVSGVVSAGTAGQLAQYAVNGNVVSGTTSVPYSYLTGFPAACAANQVAVQVGATLGCASLTTSYLPLSGTWAFAGTLSGNFSITGILAGNYTHTGNRTDQGNNTHSGTEGFTGAVTISNVNGDIYMDSVKYTTVAAAIAALPSGGTVRITAGTYTITASLVMVNNLDIECSPNNATTLQASASFNAPLISASAINHFRIAGCVLDGNRAGNTNQFNLLQILNSSNGEITGNHFQNNQSRVLWVSTGNSHLRITDNEINNYGQALPASTGNEGIVIAPVGSGAGNSHIEVSSNRVHDGNIGVAVYTSSNTANTTSDIDIAHNRVYSVANDGILFFNSGNGALVQGLRLEDNETYCVGWPANGTGFSANCTAGLLQTGATASSSGVGIDLNGWLLDQPIVIGNRSHDNFYEGIDAVAQSITVVNCTNVANSVCTATSGDRFDTTWPIGQTVSINGTDRLVQNVASTTQLTVTTNTGALTGVQLVAPNYERGTLMGNVAYNNGRGNSGASGSGFSDSAIGNTWLGNISYSNQAYGFIDQFSVYVTHTGDKAYNNSQRSAGSSSGFASVDALNASYINITAFDSQAVPTQTTDVLLSGLSSNNYVESTGIASSRVTNSGTNNSFRIGRTFFGDAPCLSTTGSGGTYCLQAGSPGGAFTATLPAATGVLFGGSTTFAGLGTPANGNAVYCSDCTIANPCAGAGTGAIAKRLNGIWVCN